MRNKTRALALSGVLTGLCTVLLIAGSLIGIGTYAAPLFAGVALLPVGMTLGRKWQTAAWISASLLSFMLLTDREEALMFSCLFGWYPIAKPWFDSKKKPAGTILKFAALNICAAAVEALVMLVLMPEAESIWFLLALLLLANLLFVMYDRLLPTFEILFRYRLLRKLRIRCLDE